jgi:long-chain fatty acid transport protein
MRRALATVTALAAFALARSAAANPMDAFGFGSRGPAMGNAVSADVVDASAGYYNPAGLARAPGIELSVGYFRASHYLKTNGTDNQVDPVSGLVGGIVLPGKILGIPVAFGVAVHLPDDRISRVRALRQEQPRWELYDNRNQRLFLAANLAISPWPWLQLGGGVSFMSSTAGRLDITGSANIFNATQSQLRHEVDAYLTAVRYPQAGARVELSKRAALALVYRGEFRLELDLRARLEGDLSQLTTAYYALAAYSVNAFLPQQVVFGGSFLPHDRVRVNADLTWVNWGAYIPPVASLTAALDIPPPQGGWPPGITPPSQPTPTTIVKPPFRDRIVPHVGVEVKALELPNWQVDLRGGWEWARTPIGLQDGVTNYVDRDRHTFSLGAGVRLIAPGKLLPGELRLDVHTTFSWLPTTLTTKRDPADLVGDYSAGGTIWSGGANLTVSFR